MDREGAWRPLTKDHFQSVDASFFQAMTANEMSLIEI